MDQGFIQAMWMLHSGMTTSGRPTIGSWVSYGLDHARLTFRHNSRDDRLTDVHDAKVLNELIG